VPEPYLSRAHINRLSKEEASSNARQREEKSCAGQTQSGCHRPIGEGEKRQERAQSHSEAMASRVKTDRPPVGKATYHFFKKRHPWEQLKYQESQKKTGKDSEQRRGMS